MNRSRICLWLFLALGLNGFAVAAQNPGQAAPESAASAVPPQSSIDKALHLYRTGKYDDAVVEYNSLTKNGPDAAAAYVGLARTYLKKRQPAEAYAAAQKAMEFAPNLPAAHVALGEVYFRQAKLAEAENEFRNVARSPAGSREARAYLGLAQIYWAASYNKHAKVAIDIAHQLDPADPDIRRDWLETLRLPERLRELQAYLGRENNEDAKERGLLEHELVLLQDEEAQPARRCRLVTKIAATEARLQPLMYDVHRIEGFGLQVMLNGTSSKLLLDTGSTGILVDRKVAEKAGVQRVVQAGVRGIGDKEPASSYVGYADSIRIGDLEFHGCYVAVLEKSSVLGRDGLIGADIFSDFLVDIDFPNRKLRVSELPANPEAPKGEAALASRSDEDASPQDPYVAPAMKEFTKVYQIGHDLLVPVRVNDSAPALFLLDTGAFDNTISPDFARRVTKVHSNSDTIVKGLSGEVKKVYSADEVNVQFSHFQQRRQDLVAFDTSAISNDNGIEVSGTLGFGMLWMLEIKIDYRDGLIDFSYDTNRFH